MRWYFRVQPQMWRDRPSCRAGTLFIADLYPPRRGTGTNGQALNQGIIVDMSRL